MPRYRVRLQEPDGANFRVSHVNAETDAEAAAICVRLDREIVADPGQPHDKHLELAYVIERGQPIPPVDEWLTQPPEPAPAEEQ